MITLTSGSTGVGSGAVSFDLTFPGGTPTAPVTLNETLQPGYTLVPLGTQRELPPPGHQRRGDCHQLGSDRLRRVGGERLPGQLQRVQPRAQPAATLGVDKQWVINGQTFAEGAQPPDFAATLSIGGTSQGGGCRTGFQQGGSTVLSETVQLSRLQCTLDSSRVTLPTGTGGRRAAVQRDPGRGDQLLQDHQQGDLRLAVDPGQVGAGECAGDGLDADRDGPGRLVARPGGTSGVTPVVTAGSRYVLSESGGDPRYVQRADPAAVPIPGSTVSWICVEVDAAGNVVPGFSDGLNGGVTMPSARSCAARPSTRPRSCV